MSVTPDGPRTLVDPRPNGDDGASPSWQVSVIGGMLATLDTLSAAGQHHVMSKVLAVVREQVRRASPLVSRPKRAALAGLLKYLQRESERRSPDPSVFAPCAERLIEILAIAR